MYYGEAIPENLGTTSRDKERSAANKLRNRQSKIFEKKQKIYSIAPKLKRVINHCDVRRGVCVANLNAKEKRSFAKNSRNIKSNGLKTIQIYE